jgi:hypothetical protein
MCNTGADAVPFPNQLVCSVTGDGAHAYPINRQPMDLFQSKEINYHYIDVKVNQEKWWRS